MSEENIYWTKLNPFLYLPSEFQWIKINFAPLRPTGFGNFHRAGRGGQSFHFAGQTFSLPHGAGRDVHPCFIVIKNSFHLFSSQGDGNVVVQGDNTIMKIDSAIRFVFEAHPCIIRLKIHAWVCVSV